MLSSLSVGLLALKALPETLRDRLHVAGVVADQLEMPLFLVGGAARDLLLGFSTTDADLIVEGDSLGFAGRLAEAFNARILTHQRFGTATVTFGDGARVDVAMARSERYPAPGALPVVRPGTIADDLKRRDFTINAIAIRLNGALCGELVDPYGGLADLQQCLIRVLHTKSFVDDPTRLFRAVRFEQRLSFRMVEETERLFRNAVTVGSVDRLSGNRLGKQLCHLFEEPNPWKCLHRLSELGVLQAIQGKVQVDETVETAFMALDRNRFSVKPLFTPAWSLYLLALCRNMPDASLTALRTRLRQDGDLGRALQDLPAMSQLAQQIADSQGERPSSFYATARKLSYETVVLFALVDTRLKVRLWCLRHLVRDRQIHLSINGHSLADLGIPQGPVYARLLERVLMEKLDGQIQTEDEERICARKIWMSYCEEHSGSR